MLLVGIFVVLVAMHWQLALLSLATVPFLFTTAFMFARQLRPIFSVMQQETAFMTTVLQENLAGLRVVRAFTREPEEIAKFDQTSRRLSDITARGQRLFALRNPLLQLIAGVGTMAILWYGGIQVVHGTLSLGTLVAFNAYLALLARPTRMLGMTINTYARAIAAGERVFEILDAEADVREKPHALDLKEVRGHVRLENVGYQSEGTWILRSINLEAKPGQVIGIVGSTGSGKSTIINLLPRFYDVTEGRITVDGHDIRDLTLKSLRTHIGIVAQETFLFSTTIRENISYGRPNSSMDDVIAAAKAAQAHDFISRLPDGYETRVGERGVTLSGGQKQRIAIARALLLNPRILILDESTSSVDTQTEAALQEALKVLMHGRTTFIIAQRLSSVREADEIIVLDQGQIVQRGTHVQLVQQPGLYHDMYEFQLREQEELLARQQAAASADGVEANGDQQVAAQMTGREGVAR